MTVPLERRASIGILEGGKSFKSTSVKKIPLLKRFVEGRPQKISNEKNTLKGIL